MKITRRCDFTLDDGYKCSNLFNCQGNNNRKFCDMHVGNSQGQAHLTGHHGLVESSNRYAVTGNAEIMQKWVKHKMNIEPKERKRIEELEREVKRLQTSIDKIDTNSKIISRLIRKEMRSSYFRKAVDALIVKRIRKSTNITIRKDINQEGQE